MLGACVQSVLESLGDDKPAIVTDGNFWEKKEVEIPT